VGVWSVGFSSSVCGVSLRQALSASANAEKRFLTVGKNKFYGDLKILGGNVGRSENQTTWAVASPFSVSVARCFCSSVAPRSFSFFGGEERASGQTRFLRLG
jgi:hypothetical protein